MSSFYGCPYNGDVDVKAAEKFRTPLHIVDVTLREGQQAPGVAFSPDGELAVAGALVAAGVTIVQAGYAVRDDETVARLRRHFPELRLAVLAVGWTRALTAGALQATRDAGASVCSILMRSSSKHLANLSLTTDKAVRIVAEATARARAADFDEVIVAPSFATLADFDFLLRLFDAGLAEGASVVSIADSTGIAKPLAVRSMVRRLRDRYGETVGIKLHMHNDYGLALANTLSGLEAGADWADASVLGMGERAGNCATEQIVVALAGLYGLDTGIDPKAITTLCHDAASAAGIAIPPMQPVVGENVFSNKLELHVKAIAQDPALLEPYDPVGVGGRRTLRLGRGTGPTAVLLKAAELGLVVPEGMLDGIVAAINDRAVDGSEVTDEAFAKMIDGGER
ncbi:MAG: LeuA family protein [Actinomycetota bacterium]|nr:LeuA family protein [Actinomycetota bacterium]